MHAFGPLSTLFHAADRPRASEAEIAWYAQHVPPGVLSLELMCGYGRLLVPLAATGCKVHGVDLSAAMLARCEDMLGADGLTAPTFRQDIVQMNLPFRYGCAFVAGGSFQLITDPAAMAAALERIRAHLVDPGILYVECRIPAARDAAARRAIGRSAHGQARRRHADRVAVGDDVVGRCAPRARGKSLRTPARRAAAGRGARNGHDDLVCARGDHGARARRGLSRSRNRTCGPPTTTKARRLR